VPAGFRANGLSFGVTLIAPAFCDADLAAIADRLHRADAWGMGANRSALLPDASRIVRASPSNFIEIFVVGAHLTGMPLNGELKNLGGIFRREAHAAPDYRLFVLPNTQPAKPGLVRAPGTNGPWHCRRNLGAPARCVWTFRCRHSASARDRQSQPFRRHLRQRFSVRSACRCRRCRNHPTRQLARLYKQSVIPPGHSARFIDFAPWTD
jgi:hypothetical protein